MERTLIIFKPDAVQRGLCGEILTRFEKKGLQIVGMKFAKLPPQLVERHYEPHKGKPFYDSLLQFLTSGPTVAMVWEGREAVAVARTLMGPTDPIAAAPGSIRGDYATKIGENVVHGSDSAESSARELKLFFGE